MFYLLEWLNGLLRVENTKAMIGSIKRRMFGLNFLEMRITLNDKIVDFPTWDGVKVSGYSDQLERRCISVLNSVGSLGPWNRSRFKKEILSSVEDKYSDIFIISNADSIIGFTVLHKKSLNNNLNEIGYVAVSPKYRGKKVGYKLLMHILSEMKRRNIYHAYLRTDSFRIPAIKTYLKAGFYPYIKDENENKRWKGIMNKLRGYEIGNKRID